MGLAGEYKGGTEEPIRQLSGDQKEGPERILGTLQNRLGRKVGSSGELLGSLVCRVGSPPFPLLVS